MSITKQYSNPNNGGCERIKRDGDNFYISSDWGSGFCEYKKVSRKQAEDGLRFTKAPSDVVSAIFGVN